MILLDTCTLLWLVTNRSELSVAAVRAIDSAGQVCVSATSAFEIGVKYRRGTLVLPGGPEDFWSSAVDRLNLVELAITPAIALLSTALPTSLVIGGKTLDHRDPGDRFIVASARAHALGIVTPDEKIAAYPDVSVIW